MSLAGVTGREEGTLSLLRSTSSSSAQALLAAAGIGPEDEPPATLDKLIGA